jgi:hypothetical protein
MWSLGAIELREKRNDGILRLAIPDVEELEHYMGLSADPLDEEGDIPAWRAEEL